MSHTGLKKTILITGSGSGIGFATAIALAERGHSVLATTHTKQDASTLTELAKQRQLPLVAFVLDVTNASDQQKILDYDLDVLINNAGVGETGSLAEVELDKIKNTFEVNVFSPLRLTQLALRKMLSKDSGSVIFISSLLGRVPAPFFGPYSMSKFALSSGVEMLRSELKMITKNVTVAVVEPGAYHTGFNQKMMQKKFEWMDQNSYFFTYRDGLKKKEERQFALAESSDLTSIVNKIVEAAEADTPRLRYSAPWWQSLGVRILRGFGG